MPDGISCTLGFCCTESRAGTWPEVAQVSPLSDSHLIRSLASSSASPYTPVGMIGWDQAVFRRDSDGKRRLLSIDQLLRRMNDWK